MPAFSIPTPAGARVLYLAQSQDESNDSVRVEFPTAQITHISYDKLETISSVPASSFDFVLTRPQLPFSPPFLASILASLCPGGSFLALLPLSAPSSGTVASQLVLNGFVDVNAVERAQDGVLEIAAQRPPWGVNASAPLKLKKKAAAPAPVAVPTPASKSVWNLAASDLNDLDAELADEDDLLAKDPFVAPAPRAVPADCGPGAGPTKKACKNCSCGLAEEQAAAAGGDTEMKAAAPAKIVSACGSVSSSKLSQLSHCARKCKWSCELAMPLTAVAHSYFGVLLFAVLCMLVWFGRCIPLQWLPVLGKASIYYVIIDWSCQAQVVDDQREIVSTIAIV